MIRMRAAEDRGHHRLVPDDPFPAYAFIPGRFPHPTGDPAGHSYGANPAPPSAVDPERWQECRPYLYGIDLFNGGYYWESHVAWESLWLASGRKGVTADFLKGLIKLAAAGVKALEGKPEGVKSHVTRAAELWRGLNRWADSEADPFMGFRIADLIRTAEMVYKHGWPTQPPLLIPSSARRGGFEESTHE
jgi:hypothetical protein